jgi:hypothetical protein
MRESSTGAEAIPRQVARVRRRRNVHTLARALCATIAIGATVLALLVALALAAGPRAFTTGCALLATTLIVAMGWLLRRAGRAWLGKARAPAWIDRSAGLEGRLATLLELRRRDAEAFFLPLLEEENRRRLSRWEPQRLVPQRVPRGALVAAAVALTAFASLVAFAPGLAPAPPRATSADEIMHAVPARPGDVARRVASVGAEADKKAGLEPLAQSPAVEAPREPEPTSLARALQKRIRRELWGDEPRAEPARRPPGKAKGAPSEERDDAASEDSWQVAKGSRGDRPARPENEPVPRAQLEAAGDEAPDDAARAPADTEERPVGSGGGASGAGSGTDPNLFGPEQARGDAPNGRFELGIVARVRTHRASPHPPTGAPPPAAPDERPVLGARQRQEIAVRRMIVPPAFEPIVRRVFAHGTEDQ